MNLTLEYNETCFEKEMNCIQNVAEFGKKDTGTIFCLLQYFK